MLQVRLDPGLPSGRWACLRPVRGRDEQTLAHGGGGLAAVELLDRLLVEVQGTSVGPGRAWELAVSDRDRLLAAVYAWMFGDRIESEVECDQCGETSDIDFSLAALVASLEPSPARLREHGIAAVEDGGVYELEDGTRFRLPTSHDQRELLGLPPGRQRRALLGRCVLPDAGDQARTASDMSAELLDRVEAAMAIAGPAIDLDLPVACHECRAERQVRFDIQHYLLRALEHEHRYFAREVHYLASCYGWTLDDILSLSREDRRGYVRLVAAERASRHRSALQ